MNKVVLITGANAGIGKESARQLALKSETEKVILACRNEAKAIAAKKELEAQTGRNIFEILIMDVSSTDSVRNAVAQIKEPIDSIIMNAGGLGGPTPNALTEEGVTHLFASNVLGHALFLETLLENKLLNNVALFVGSEAIRGVPQMGMKVPELQESSAEEFKSIANGSFWGEDFDAMQAYGPTKYLGAMWMNSLSRKYPSIKFLTVSPGATQGTEAANSLPPFQRFMMKHVMMKLVLPMRGMAHSLEAGSKRLVDAISDPALETGTFYASKKNMTGPISDQSDFLEDLEEHAFPGQCL